VKLYFVIYGLICLSVFGKGQTPQEYYPHQFGQFMQTIGQVNPAHAGLRSKVECRLGNQTQTGDWNISTYYASLNYGLQDDPLKNKNAIGIRFYNDNEGNFLRRSLIHVNYAWHTEISDRLNFAGGISGGFFNYYIKGSALLGTSSTYAPDANAGILLYKKTYRLSISINQLFNNNIQPFTEITNLKRHYNFYASKTFSLAPYLKITPHVLYRTPFFEDYNLDGGITTHIFDLIYAGYTLRYRFGMVFMLGIKNFEWNYGTVDFLFSYNYPIKSTDITVDKFELTLGYYFEKNTQR
jgi:type IX secretion system PorP/SprF family membrane protein